MEAIDWGSPNDGPPPSLTFLWRPGEGFSALISALGIISSLPSDISSEGTTVVGGGRRISNAYEAHRWTSTEGMQLLGTPPTDPLQLAGSFAIAVSADGGVVVGNSSSGLADEAFRWTQETGMVGLGHLPGGRYSSSATGISADGKTIVGYSASARRPTSSEPFRWTAEEGMVSLGFLDPEESSSTARFASYDGSIVFESSSKTFVDEDTNRTKLELQTFVWDKRFGMREFIKVVQHEPGLETSFEGWSRVLATGISDDSRSLVGFGTNPDGNVEAWLVRLDRPFGVPEPASMLLALLAAAFVFSCHPDKQFRGFHGTNHRAA